MPMMRCAKSCAAVSKVSARRPRHNSPCHWACRLHRSTLRSPRSNRKATYCKAAIPAARRRSSGANAACSRAFIVTPCSSCAARSNRSVLPTSCASCCAGSTSVRRVARAARRLPRCWSSWRATPSPPPRGRPTSCRRASKAITRRCSTASAARAVSHGCVCKHRKRSAAADVEQSNLTATAQKVADTLQQHGASFFIDLVHHTGMLRTQVEESLGDLAARGLVTADSYAGLRALITPAQRKAGYGRHARRRGGASIDEAGRWELLRKTVTPERDSERIEHIARALLRRYGVVFRKLLERESKLPTWRELLYVYRRMEARGELRGGRFVQGYSGEQFALPEAGGSLRDTRKRPAKGEFITLSAADPLNLAGILTPGTKVPALAGNRVLFRDGVPVATTIAGEFEALQTLSAEEQRQMRERLAGKFPTSFSAKRPA